MSLLLVGVSGGAGSADPALASAPAPPRWAVPQKVGQFSRKTCSASATALIAFGRPA